MSSELPIAGVHALDHTADVGIEVSAPDREALFIRAALGMGYLLLETVPDADAAAGEKRPIELSADGAPGLLRSWLRELLYLHERDGFAFVEASFDRLCDDALHATVRGADSPAQPIREIKGVTLHGLIAERRGADEWFARVIFDV